MRLIAILVGLAALASVTEAQTYYKWNGYCQQGGQTVKVGSVSSTSKVQGSFPGCTVLVSNHGAGTAAIYQSDSGNALANPFTADAVTGQINFYAAPGHYDITIYGAGVLTATWPDIIIGLGGGTVNDFFAPANQWPAWLVPSVVTPTTTATLSVLTPNQPAAYFVASPASTSGPLNPRLIQPSDVPVLNQNTTGTASAFTATPTQAPSGEYCTGITVSGNCIPAVIQAAQVNAIGAIRYATLPSSCTAGVNPVAVVNSGGIDAVYTCDNTGHYALPPGGSTTVLSGAITGTGGANVIGGGTNGLVVSSSSGTLSSTVAAPSGTVVGTTDPQTLTNKNLAGAGNVFPTFNQNTTGNAATATTASTANALASAPTNCPLGFTTPGVSANGNSQNCVLTSGCLNILTYGGHNDSSTPNDAAWTAVIAASIPDQVCIYFPAGHYVFNSIPTWTAPTATASLTLKGDSYEVSQALFPNSNGFTLNVIGAANSLHVRDLSIRTGAVGTRIGIAVVNTSGIQTGYPSSDFTNLMFYGSDGYAASDYWATGIDINAFSNVNYTNVGFIGAPSGTSGLGVLFNLHSSTGVVSVTHNLTQINCAYSNVCLQIADHIQGVTWDHSNATAVSYGVYVTTGIPYGDNDQLTIGPGVQFNASVYGILIQSPFRHTQIIGDYFVVPASGNAMLFDEYAMTSVIGNHMIHVGGGSASGIIFDHYSNDDAKVFGNDSQFFTVGLNLTANSQHVTAFMNNGVSNTTDVVNSGTGNCVSTTFTGAPTGSFQVCDGVIVHQ